MAFSHEKEDEKKWRIGEQICFALLPIGFGKSYIKRCHCLELLLLAKLAVANLIGQLECESSPDRLPSFASPS